MREHNGLKPQDVVVLLWLTLQKEIVRQIDIAQALKISPSEIGLSLARLKKSRLITQEKKPIRAAVQEFVIHGLKYLFPVEPGALTRGIATAHSAPPLSEKVRAAAGDGYVWPDAQGKIRGQAITPLYKTVPSVTKNDSALYEMLTLIDALRVGRARESSLAVEELKKRFKGA